MVYCTVCMKNNRKNKDISYFTYPKDAMKLVQIKMKDERTNYYMINTSISNIDGEIAFRNMSGKGLWEFIRSGFKSKFIDRCKRLRPCYEEMLFELREKDEKNCMDDIEVGTSTLSCVFDVTPGHKVKITARQAYGNFHFLARNRRKILYSPRAIIENASDRIFIALALGSGVKFLRSETFFILSPLYMIYFKALEKYCSDIFNVTSDYSTAELRNLYEVNIHKKTENNNPDPSEVDTVPIILIDAGQKAGREPVKVVLSIIERLMACEENEHMIQNMRWVFLPCTNPDGLEYVRFDRPDWSKNTRKIGDGASYGIDISRNFDAHWNECEQVKSALDPKYPGPSAASEIETKFIRNTLLKYKDEIKAYLSFRRDGHGIFYPHAYADKTDDVDTRQVKAAEMVSLKVNQRGSSLNTFVNDSIYRQNGRPVCGNSVDYAYSQGIPMPYEFRVGFEKDLEMLSAFQQVNPGFHSTLRAAYFTGIRELYTILAAK